MSKQTLGSAINPSSKRCAMARWLSAAGWILACSWQLEAATPFLSATQNFFGLTVIDPAPWLDKPDSAQTLEWTEQQANRARAFLDQVPTRRYIENRLHQWSTQAVQTCRQFQWSHGDGFAVISTEYLSSASLVRFSGNSIRSNQLQEVRVIANPAALGGALDLRIGWYALSPNGSKVAVLLQSQITLEQTLHFWDLTSGTKLPDVLPVAAHGKQRAGLLWNRDGTEVAYTRFNTTGLPPLAAAPVEMFLHRLGTPADSDRKEFQGQLPSSTRADFQHDPTFTYSSFTLENSIGEERVHWLREEGGRWKVLAQAADRVDQVAFGRDPIYVEAPRDDGIYLLSRDHAPRGKLLRTPLRAPNLANAALVLPESKDVLDRVVVSASGIYGSYLKGGSAQLLFFDLFEKDYVKGAMILPLPHLSALPELVLLQGDRVAYRAESYTAPSEWQIYDPTVTREFSVTTALFDNSPVDFQDAEVERLVARSEDGTKIPIFLLQRRGTRRNGETPILLEVSGGFGVSQLPRFQFTDKVWLNQGGALAFAQLRGGREAGPDWHLATQGAAGNKALEDLSACVGFLIRSNYTRPGHLALRGLDHGASLVARYGMSASGSIRGMILENGGYDGLRAAELPEGKAFADELGTTDRRDLFLGLKEASAYAFENVPNPPPEALLVSDPEGDRFASFHSRKLAWKLQLSARGTNQVLYHPYPAPSAIPANRARESLRRIADRYVFLFDRLGLHYSLVERGPWSGAVTPTTAVVKAKVMESGMVVRLAVSRSAVFENPVWLGPVRTESSQHQLASFSLTDLTPDTTYHYALEVNGRLDWPSRGKLRTFPIGNASFKIAFASCSKTASTSDVFDRIRENDPLFFMNTGDFHYLNINANKIERFREAYDLVLSSIAQSELYRSLPFIYMWDDHDYGGNNSNRRASSHEAARRAYDEYVPHYPLVAGGGDQPIYQSFSVGRVKFILTDLRSDRDDVKKTDNADKTMMGTKQKAWFKQELLQSNGKFPLICWVSSVPWMGVPGTNYYPHIKNDHYGFIHHTNFLDSASRTNRAKPSVEEDHWSVFTTERREIADFIKANHIQGVCILHGDSHMLAADDGSHSDYSTGGGGARIPVMCAAPLDQTPSIKGGPYSQGVYRVRPNEGCFGLLEVADRGDHLDVSFSGRNNENKEKIGLKFSVPATSPLSTP